MFSMSLLHADWFTASSPPGGAILRGSWALPKAGSVIHQHPTARAW